MNQLHIYPTSRALRTVSSYYKEQDGLLPALMRMDEFEQRAVLLENRTQIDPLQRILFLREAAKFESFAELKFDHELVLFFTKSDAIFKFFEELAAENVEVKSLIEADAYAEFDTHIAILETLLTNYKKLLDKEGFTDRAFIPKTYRINEGFLHNYDKIEIHLEGYLSHFELELLEKIAHQTELIIHYTTSSLNAKMQERIKVSGIKIQNNSHTTFNLTDKSILTCKANRDSIDAEVISVQERHEQIAVAFVKIEAMVRSGIAPEDIVLILPDESFKESFMLYDQQNNLNFAMGYDYDKKSVYKKLEALYAYWKTFDKESKELLEYYGLDIETVKKISASKSLEARGFFEYLEILDLMDKKSQAKEQVYEKQLHFMAIFEKQKFSAKQWLFLWLQTLSKITIDDIRGGLVTVMGVLETRGVAFEGVVIVDFNEGIVPATSSKDQFLNSQVRAFAGLPTKKDREALQKQYYKRLLEQASQAVILYSTSDSKLPSKFLYELRLGEAIQADAQHNLLYSQPSQLVEPKPFSVSFDPKAIIWSASRLRTFLECKYKYYYKYILKIDEKDREEISEGQFLHQVLEKLFEKQSSYDSKAVMQKELDMLINRLHPNDDAKAAYQKLLWSEKLKGFAASQIDHFSADWHVVEREQEFSGEINGLQFKGRIDRIDQNSTQTLVLDYKSGRVEKEPKTLNSEKITDFQMPIYQQLLSGKYQNISLAYLKILENGEMQELRHLEERNELLEEHIEELKKSTSFVVERCDESRKCRFCEGVLMLD